MAINYSFREFVKVFQDGTDADAMKDCGGRFPLLTASVNKILGASPEALEEIMKFFPDYVNARKANKTIEQYLNGELDGSESDEAAGEHVEEEKSEVEEEPKPKRGRRKAAPKAEPEVAEESASEDEGEYTGKSAVELFKLCKSKGIKAAPKKPEKYYIELLEKADSEPAKDESEDDDWDI